MLCHRQIVYLTISKRHFNSQQEEHSVHASVQTGHIGVSRVNKNSDCKKMGLYMYLAYWQGAALKTPYQIARHIHFKIRFPPQTSYFCPQDQYRPWTHNVKLHECKHRYFLVITVKETQKDPVSWSECSLKVSSGSWFGTSAKSCCHLFRGKEKRTFSFFKLGLKAF